MKKVTMEKATESLAEYAGTLNGAPLVVTKAGKPVAVLVPVDCDMETLAVGMNEKFLDIIEHSRRRQQAEGGISSEALRRKLGLGPRPKKDAVPKGNANLHDV